MIKKGKLEAVSFKHKRIKFDGVWLAVDPFLNLDNVEFGGKYSIKIQQDNDGSWFVAEVNSV